MKYELIIIWGTGEKEVFEYSTEEKAQEACKGYRTAFGNQVAWARVRKVVK